MMDMELPAALNNRPTMRKQVWRISDDVRTAEEIEMVLEEPLSLQINGHQAAVLMRLPGMEKELVAGFCLSEGLVARFADVLTIHHCGQGLPSPTNESASGVESRNQIEMRVRAEALRPEARLDVVRLIRAGCGAVDIERADLPLTALSDQLRVNYQVLLGLEKGMRQGQHLHQEVGGVHAAALFEPGGELVALCEDIGRHNAVDKAVGYCLLRDIPLYNKLLLCSGRLSYEMVTKAIRVGLPLLASVSAPTALAIQLAERFNVTVVGYLRGRKMTIYTHPERVNMP
jgi:FdhD protein